MMSTEGISSSATPELAILSASLPGPKRLVGRSYAQCLGCCVLKRRYQLSYEKEEGGCDGLFRAFNCGWWW